MSRHGSNGSYDHSIRRIVFDHYRLEWAQDRYYASSRLRHPIGFHRDTDYAGAVRFAKRWRLPIPVPQDGEDEP